MIDGSSSRIIKVLIWLSLDFPFAGLQMLQLSEDSLETSELIPILDAFLSEFELTGLLLLSSSLLFLVPSFLEGSDPNLSNIWLSKLLLSDLITLSSLTEDSACASDNSSSILSDFRVLSSFRYFV